MNAIELNAVAHDGRVQVEIPDEYREAWDEKPVRVILMMDERSPTPRKESLLSKLKQVQISGPEDFSDEHDAYLSGEKHA